jgi:hypothetical protein
VSQVIQFPAAKVVERDVRGALMREVMEHIAAAADWLDSPEARRAGKDSAAVRLGCMYLTTRLLEVSTVMNVARAWVEGRSTTKHWRGCMVRSPVRVGNWPPGEMPARLAELQQITDTLSHKVEGAKARFLQATAPKAVVVGGEQ